MDKGFEVVVMPDMEGENRVRARLAQWPHKLYKEDELRELERSPCLTEKIKDIASYARMAVIQEKSRMGLLSKGFKASAHLPPASQAFGIEKETTEDREAHAAHFAGYCDGRSEAERIKKMGETPYDHYEDYAPPSSRFHGDDASYEV